MVVLSLALSTGCAGSMANRLPEGQRGVIRGARVEGIVARPRAWSAALAILTQQGYTLQVSDPVGGIISTAWSPWDCMTDSQKMWGSMLANVTGGCEKQASVTFGPGAARIRMAARICTQSAGMGRGAIASIGTPSLSCRDNDWKPYADQLAKEQAELALAIKAAGTSTAPIDGSPARSTTP